MRDTPYSRYPVYRGNDHDVIGVLEAKAIASMIGSGSTDLFRDLRPPLFVSESTRALSLLEIFRDEGAHLALVVDEYGDIQGVVTLNDARNGLRATDAILRSLATGGVVIP